MAKTLLKKKKSRTRLKISIIIACYKDAQAIPIMYARLVETFKTFPAAYEIIFVNDGSPDTSEEVIRKIIKKDSNVVGINHSRNFSSQMAFTSGMDLATGNAVVFMDGDLQDPPELIAEFFTQWQNGFDVVYGIRVQRDAPLIMQFLYKAFYRLFHSLSNISIPLDAGDFSLLDRKVVEAMKLFPERDRFMRGLRAWVGFKQTGIPYVRPERMFGVTTNNFLKNFQWAKKGIFSFSFVPLQTMTLISLFFFFFAVIGIIYQLGVKFFYPNLTPPGVTTVIIVILFLGAVQLLGLSLLGEYLGKVLEEVKQRPLYIRKSVLRKKKK